MCIDTDYVFHQIAEQTLERLEREAALAPTLEDELTAMMIAASVSERDPDGSEDDDEPTNDPDETDEPDPQVPVESRVLITA